MSQLETPAAEVSPTASSIHFTEGAAKMLLTYQQEENNFDLCLRLSVEGGGCAGLKYHLDLVEGQEADDVIIEKTIDSTSHQPAIVKLLVDPFSYMYVNQAEVDYIEDITGKRFAIRNPNAQTTCGCGSSFAPTEN